MAEIWDKAQEADDELGKVIEESGLQEKTVKHCGPNHCMVFLGVLFDSKSLTLSVMEDSVQEIMEILESRLDKSTASQKEYQVLLGKLNFVVSCIRQGWIFVSHIIAYMKTLVKVGKFPLPQSVK